MKHIKQYEELKINDEPELGDYVICHEEPDVRGNLYAKDEINDFLSKNIGQFVLLEDAWYEVKYENLTTEIDHWFHASKRNCRSMLRSEIIHYAKTKEELEHFIAQNKYNL